MTSSRTQLRIGTRSSRLARWQADHVCSRLRELGADPTIVFIQTTGDLDKRTDFGSMGAKGIFVLEIENALRENRIDLAVHSLKDLPTELPAGLVLGGVLERASPYDALVSRNGCHLRDLDQGATIATGSLRRASQVLAIRRDLKIVPLRGNVPTRIDKIRQGQADATLLAVAGLRRLGLHAEAAQEFSPEEITPAMGQGALAIESREGEHLDLLSRIEHPPTRQCVRAERLFIAKVGGGCKTPVGILVEPGGSKGWTMTAMLASADGASLLRESREIASPGDLDAAAEELGARMLEKADDAIRETLIIRD